MNWPKARFQYATWSVTHVIIVHVAIPIIYLLERTIDNTVDAFNKGRLRKYPSRLTDDEVNQIRQLLDQGVNQYEIAKQFNVRQPHISRINTGVRRSSVPEQEITHEPEHTDTTQPIPNN